MNQKSEKKILVLGISIVLMGLVVNQWVLSFFFSRDGISSIKTKMGIWFFQALLIVFGFFMIVLRKKIIQVFKAQVFKSKQRIFIAITTLLAMAICFGIPELLLRFVKPQMTYSKLQSLVKIGLYRPGDFIPFTLKKNIKITAPSQEFPGKKVNVTTNSLGLRGKEITIKKPPATKRILILGDSYTYGAYVDDTETYSAVLQKMYKDQNLDVEVINAGFADGWGPDEHYAWLINRGLDFQPDIIVYGFFIGNDLEDSNDLVWKDLDKRGLPTRIQNDNIYVSDEGYIRSRKKDYKTAGVAPIYKIPILRESHLCVFISSKLQTIKERSKVDDTHRGWGREPFPFIFKKENDAQMNLQEERFKKLVKGISEVAQENDAKFLLLMIPINFQVDPSFLKIVMGTTDYSVKRNYFQELTPWLNKEEIENVDLLDIMLSQTGRYYPLNGEVHFNPKGHQLTAESIKAKIDQLKWIR